MDSDDITQIAFMDARRLGRIRLCASPLTEPPISSLGFDPVLSMPSLKDFSVSVLKRACPIKALLLDQSFSAGVGNYVAGGLSPVPIGSSVSDRLMDDRWNFVSCPRSSWTTMQHFDRNSSSRTAFSDFGCLSHCCGGKGRWHEISWKLVVQASMGMYLLLLTTPWVLITVNI